MQLRDALDDYKRHRDAATRFPGERRSTAGLLTGQRGRLVHVGASGRVRDYSYPLVGLNGIERSRFAVRTDGRLRWLDDADATQHYHADTDLVVTEHALPEGDVTQYDLAVDAAHLTRFETELDCTVVAYYGLAPDRQETQIGQLRHDRSVEVYHADEHDYLASTRPFEAVTGQTPAQFAELLGDDPVTHPRPVADGRYEEGRLSGDVVVEVDADGGATLCTLLTDVTDTPREAAVDAVDAKLARFDDAAAFVAAAEDRRVAVPDDTPDRDAVVADLRVLGLLSAPSGRRIAGPDFDPFYAYSGGYGYTWFRDDAEISGFLRDAAEAFDLPLDDWHARSARGYLDTQRADGSWPHRVWPHDGRLAPGWANARIEGGDDADYQADQTGSVVAFLADYLPDAPPDLASDIEDALVTAVDSLDDTLAADGLPVSCQNAWENMTGRFTHTAATFLEAYSAAAAAPLPDDVTAHARTQADRVYDALDDLWVADRGVYALRLDDGALDERYDSAALSLAAAHEAYAAVGDVDAARRDRLVSHIEGTVDGLRRDPSPAVGGLVRYEGDEWRRREQPAEKIWTVSTAWGAHAAATLAALLRDAGDDRADRLERRAESLLDDVGTDGPLATANGYLPEQVFDDGTPDSATPLGWPHAIRLATLAALRARPAAVSERVTN
ncbi:glycoside hydrolase family 15 protein [Halobaculum sp. D14]|uniref:glycoside hydrolase family 15 protein n=1 Tax=unclassified Halobaculum TaxID=2640896 RepID=UPI003EBF7A0C